MRHDKYILEGKKAVPFDGDVIKWAERAFAGNRIVKQDKIDRFFVSTVFLGLDHCFGEGPPLLFETMVFDRFGSDVWMDRCSTWDEAETQHMEAQQRIDTGLIKHDYRRGIRDMWRKLKWRMWNVVVQPIWVLFNRPT